MLEFAILMPLISILLVTILGLGPSWVVGLRAQGAAEHLTWREAQRADSWIEGTSSDLTRGSWSLPDTVGLTVGQEKGGGHPEERLNLAYALAPTRAGVEISDPILRGGAATGLGSPVLTCDDTLVLGRVEWPYNAPGWKEKILFERHLYLRTTTCTTEESWGRLATFGSEVTFAGWETQQLR